LLRYVFNISCSSVNMDCKALEWPLEHD
jgi:hypothetical protein